MLVTQAQQQLEPDHTISSGRHNRLAGQVNTALRDGITNFTAPVHFGTSLLTVLIRLVELGNRARTLGARGVTGHVHPPHHLGRAQRLIVDADQSEIGVQLVPMRVHLEDLLGQCGAKRVHDSARFGHRAVLHDDAELVPTEARHDVPPPRQLPQQATELPQNRITDLGPRRVVDKPEVA